MITSTLLFTFFGLKYCKLTLLLATMKSVPTSHAFIILRPNFSTPTPAPIEDDTVDPFSQYYTIMAIFSAVGCFFAFVRFFHFIGD